MSALKGFSDSRRVREQSVRTPQHIVDIVRTDLGGAIELDPCWCEGALTQPGVAMDGSPGRDGLSASWSVPTYVNPPYKNLKPWMLKAAASSGPVIMLIPVRSHRSWWLDAFNECTACVALPPVVFEGHINTFPVPVCLMYFRCNPTTGYGLGRLK